jgi:ubiquinone/menaquinone biosynthesis C-methylase UbiE
VKTYAMRSAEQMRCPSGLPGLMAARLMRKYNSQAESWTVDQLALKPNDHVLEIGFGPGFGLAEALKRIDKGYIEGIDLSELMVRRATKANKEAIKEGKLRIMKADAYEMPFESNSFDKVFAVNVYYFWKDPAKALGEIRRVLRDQGVLAVYVIDRNDLLKMQQAQTEVFSVSENEQVAAQLKMAGFKSCTIEKRNEGFRTGVCIKGYR